MATNDEAGRREAVSFPAEAEAVAAARAHVRACLEHVPSPAIDDVCLLTSELAANAVLHARTPFSLEVNAVDGFVRVVVTDGGGGTPAIADPQPEVGGLGLRLVSTVATRWGTGRDGDETSVWFELDV